MITQNELKACLDRVFEINEKLQGIEEKMSYSRYKAAGVSSYLGSLSGSRGSFRSSLQEAWTEKYAKLQDQWYHLSYKQMEIIDLVTEISKRLQNEREALYITYRYICCMKYESIQKREDIGRNQVFLTLCQALEHMTAIINRDPLLERKYQKANDSNS